MNYCSIEDAWGSGNYASNQIKEYMSNTGFDNTGFSNNEPVKIDNPSKSNCYPSPKTNQGVKTNNKINELNDCDLFILHVQNCKKCYNKMRNQFKPQLIEKFQNIIDENRDSIVLILIGISILLFFNLINNITKN